MKKYIFLVFLLLGMVSCKKDNDNQEDIPKDIPSWLKDKIAEVKKEEYPNLTTIQEYNVEGKTYYNISLAYQSCMLCHVYDTAGNRADVEHHYAKFKLVRTIWPIIN